MVVDKVEAELLTPVGLRSLSPKDPKYVPVYIGSPFDRDSAYHQGTVWAWLIGPFIDAYRKSYPDREDRVEEILSGFHAHLTEAGRRSNIRDIRCRSAARPARMSGSGMECRGGASRTTDGQSVLLASVVNSWQCWRTWVYRPYLRAGFCTLG